jgi:hypothetical protein
LCKTTASASMKRVASPNCSARVISRHLSQISFMYSFCRYAEGARSSVATKQCLRNAAATADVASDLLQ